MSQEIRGPVKTFQAGVVLKQFQRVKLASGKLAVAVAGVTDEVKELGVCLDNANTVDDRVGVVLRSAEGTMKMIAAGAITQGVLVYGAVDGEIAAAASGAALGIALEAAAADQDIIEVLRF